MDETKLNFLSTANYMKRDSHTGSQTMSVGGFGTSSITIDHNIGHVPHYDVYATLQSDGRIWARNLPYVGMENSATTPTYTQVTSWTTANTLTIRLDNPAAGTKSIVVYYTIYKDYHA